MTNAEALLSVARTLRQPFVMEQLVVAAWRADPQKWGLRDFPQYPDSNRVSVTVYQHQGLMRRGWLRRVGLRGYHVNITEQELTLQVQQLHTRANAAKTGRPRKSA